VSSSLPTPLAAALGVMPTLFDRAKRVPGRLVQLPLLAVSNGLTVLESVRREYDHLAARGENVVVRLRGASFDEIEDRIEELAADTPLAPVYEIVEDATEDLVSRVSDLLDLGSRPAPRKTHPETAASDAVVEAVEQVSEVLTTGVPERSNLPIEDYDSLTLGNLRGRLRSLTVDELVAVRDYEKAHAHRLPVVTLLDHRIAKLVTEHAATPAKKAPAHKATAQKTPAKRAAPA
jgi:hypothetical protein